jgi:hypothetical protein
MAVLEEGARRAVRKLERAFTVPRELHQAAVGDGVRAGEVPVASSSPVRKVAPFEVRCATCCSTFE